VNQDLPKTSNRLPFRLGEFEVLPESGELRGHGGVVRLRPLLMEVLLRLAARPGEVVRRETLLDEAWERRMVNDEVLSRAIAELRTALGDDARSARYIETLPKIGYRLVAQVEPLAHRPAERPADAPERARGKPRRYGTALAFGIVVAVAAAAWVGSRTRADPGSLDRALAAARPLTSDPELELGPRLSPDGRRVAFALATGPTARIVVQAIDGSGRRFLGEPDAARLSPAFFPDGRRIAYWKAQGKDCAIVEHDLEAGTERTLVDCARSPRSRFDLSPDGTRIVFSGNAHPQYPAGLWLQEIGGRVRALTSPEPGMGDDVYPRFSPDGRRIAWFRGNESHRRPWILELDAPEGARPAGKHEGLSYGVAWLGREGPLLVAADWFGFRALNVLDPATGQARLAGARGARFPEVGPGGEIAYENAIYSANLWQVPLAAPADARMLWRATRYTNQPEFSPDGRRAAFSSNREGADAIYVAALDGAPRRIAFGDAHRYLRPHWAADGRSVLAVRITQGDAGQPVQEAVRIPVDGGPPEVLAPLGRAVNDVRESADGRWLYWAELSGHAMRLVRAPLRDPARSERLPLPAVAQYQMNAERLVYAQPQLARLATCRLDTFACEPMELEVAPGDLFHWSLGPRSLFVRVREEGAPRLARYDFTARRVVQRLALAPSGAGSSIAVSPDESQLLVVREENPQIDLMFARR
jgi:DNA-binding winged helix-turn-helix (wHTH) protein/dipeptidyl aminopeptidase/acylaminoacyl peptidase